MVTTYKNKNDYITRNINGKHMWARTGGKDAICPNN
jgi:hypothetical protein